MAGKIVGDVTNFCFSKHLNSLDRVNLGSFYTPQKFVATACNWMKKHSLASSSDWAVLDSSCGYGAFFTISEFFPNAKFIGNDTDVVAVEKCKKAFPNVKMFNENALKNINRANFDIQNGEKLIVVGNPPYNDKTSIVQKAIKNAMVDEDIDDDVEARDLGLSFLLSYNKLKADYALILHPISYLIKRANFNAAKNFFGNYEMLEHCVFSSSEFQGTSKMTSFPIIMALYKRHENAGLTYEAVCCKKFFTLEGNCFFVRQFDYIGNFAEKYPSKSKVRFSPDIKFYTMRDLNALRRSRTFILDDTANAININPKKIQYYCYVDCLKDWMTRNNLPYYLGNFDIPFKKENFDKIADDFVSVAKWRHQEIFSDAEKPSDDAVRKVDEYIGDVINTDARELEMDEKENDTLF